MRRSNLFTDFEARLDLRVRWCHSSDWDERASGKPHRTNRPLLEAGAGKNPVTHVGKLYNIAASRIAESLTLELGAIKDAACIIVSQIAYPVEDPQLVDISLVTDAESNQLKATVTDVVRAHLARLGALRDELLAGRAAVY